MKKVCEYCGSEDVYKDAFARWSERTNRWKLGEVFDKVDYCGSCEGETRIINEDEYIPNIEDREVELEYDGE